MNKPSLRASLFVVASATAAYVTLAGCGEDEATPAADAGADVAADRSTPDTSTGPDARSPEYTGSACTAASECYGDIDAASLSGEPACIDKVTGGYCTHECTTDADCCATPGECRTGLKQVCAPFESTGKKYCFLSCEDTDIQAATDAGASDAGSDGDDYCAAHTSTEFACRSTGGGQENRKVCLPVGAAGDGGKPDGAADDAGDAGDAGDADAN